MSGGGGGWKSPLTRVVCTPCYRAPEVVMSRGGYTSAIDMWSAGCVFGELLNRVAYIGKAATPQLQVSDESSQTWQDRFSPVGWRRFHFGHIQHKTLNQFLWKTHQRACNGGLQHENIYSRCHNLTHTSFQNGAYWAKGMSSACIT